MPAPNAMDFWRMSKGTGVGNTLRALEDRDIINEGRTTNTQVLKEQLNSIIMERPDRQRLLAAQASDAELKANLNGKYLEDFVRSRSEAATTANQQAQEELAVYQETALPMAQQELANAKQQGGLIELQMKGENIRARQMTAEIARANAQTTTANLENDLARRKLEETERQEKVAKTYDKYNQIETVLASTDTSTRQGRDTAIQVIRSRGIHLGTDEVDAIQNNPDAMQDMAKLYSTTPEHLAAVREEIAKRKVEKEKEKFKTNEQIRLEQAKVAAQSSANKAEAEFEAMLPKEPGEERVLPNHVVDRATTALQLNLAEKMFGSSAVVDQNNEDAYDHTIAAEMDAMARKIINTAETISKGSPTLFRQTVERIQQSMLNTYNSSYALSNDNPKEAFDAMPKDLRQVSELNTSMISAMEDPNSTEARVYAKFKETANLRDYVQSSRNFGISEGLSPLIVDYLLGAAMILQEKGNKGKEGAQ